MTCDKLLVCRGKGEESSGNGGANPSHHASGSRGSRSSYEVHLSSTSIPNPP